MPITRLPPEHRRDLSALVLRYKVVYEVYQAVTYATGRRLVNGYDVELLGTPGTERTPLPGWPECRVVWRHLRTIAEAALPDDQHGRGSEYDIRGFDNALHEGRSAGPRPRDDVRLVVNIHPKRFLSPLDESEERSLHELVVGLRELGVQQGAWSEARGRELAQLLGELPR